MATGDMLMRLLLNTQDFDKKIGRTNKKVDNLGGVGTKAFGQLSEALTKAAGAAGIAFGAYEVFNRGLKSSQAAIDTWGRSMAVLNTALDGFAYALFSFDFSTFNGGLLEMAERARDAYDALDLLSDTKLSMNFVLAQDRAEFNRLRTRARDKTLPYEERLAAVEQMTPLISNIRQATSVTAQREFEAQIATFAAESGYNITPTASDFNETFRIGVRENYAQLAEQLNRDYEAFLEKYNALSALVPANFRDNLVNQTMGRINPLTPLVTALTPRSWSQAEGELLFRSNAEELMQALVRENSRLIAQWTFVNKLDDEERAAAIERYNAATAASNATEELTQQQQELRNSISAERASSERATQATAERAVAERAAAAALEEDVHNLAASALMIYGKRAGIEFDNASLAPHAFVGKGAVLRRYDRTNAFENVDYSLPISSIDTNAAYSNFVLKQAEEQARELSTLTTSVELLGGAFASLGDSVSGAAGQMLTFAGGMVEAISKVIPFISYIWAEKVAHDANANAITAEAAAKTLSQYASIPFAGVALGIAAVGAIVAAMQSIPKLAKGGIATAPTLGLFGEAGPEAIVPLNKLEEYINVGARDVRVTGTIKAQGKELAVVLDNYGKVRSIG